MKLGALEAGGTKMVCAIGDETGKIFEQVSIPTAYLVSDASARFL